MSFGVYAAGTPEEVKEHLAASTGYGDTSQFDAVREFIYGELAGAPEDSRVVVEASGHHDTTSRNVTLTFKTYRLQKRPDTVAEVEDKAIEEEVAEEAAKDPEPF